MLAASTRRFHHFHDMPKLVGHQHANKHVGMHKKACGEKQLLQPDTDLLN